MHSRWPSVFAGVLVLALPQATAAQATVYVPPTDPVYRDIAVLVGNGLVDSLIVGQRPYSRAAIARIIRAAASKLATAPVVLAGRDERLAASATENVGTALSDRQVSFLRQLLAALSSRYAAEIAVIARDTLSGGFREVALIRSASVDLTRAASETRRFPRSNGLGEINALLNPLIAYREGRPVGEGSNLLLESTHTLQTAHLALSVTPQLLMRQRSGDSGTLTDGNLQEVQLRLLIRNFALDLGRQFVVWGQGRDAGLLSSTNSPPLDLVRISNEQLLTLPWVFRRLGPAKLSLYFANLGKNQNFPHAWTVAYKATFLPTPRFELGAAVYTKEGGKGSPPAALKTRLIDLLPFTDASNYNNLIGTHGDFSFSDHYAGIDGRLRVPAARDAQLSWELLLNDFDVRRFGSVVGEDAGHIVGLVLPRVTEDGRLGFSLEYHHTGLRYYEHHQYVSGQTLRGNVTGDVLGPNGRGTYAEVGWYANGQNRVAFQGALEVRSNNQYAYVPEPNFGFRLVESFPKERRRHLIATWERTHNERGFGILGQLGYESTANFGFVEDQHRIGWLGRLTFAYAWR